MILFGNTSYRFRNFGAYKECMKSPLPDHGIYRRPGDLQVRLRNGSGSRHRRSMAASGRVKCVVFLNLVQMILLPKTER